LSIEVGLLEVLEQVEDGVDGIAGLGSCLKYTSSLPSPHFTWSKARIYCWVLVAANADAIKTINNAAFIDWGYF
jgi:hypothetical protein